jgi:hypothetical protein
VRLALAALLLLAPAASAADEPPVRFPDLVGWYLLAGVDLGVVDSDDGADGLVGGEISAVRYRDPSNLWSGAYVDGACDLARDTWRTGVGGEVGWMILGLDGGLELSLGDETEVGIRVRAAITTGVLAAYGGYERVAGEDIGGVGLLLKWPLRITPRRPIWFGR